MGKSKAVSSLIATVLVTAIGTLGLIAAMAVLGPMFSSAQSTTVVNSAFQNLETLNAAVKGVASETQGSKRTISLSVADGFYKTNSTYDWLYFEYEPEEEMLLTGTKGNVEAERGLQFADYFNWYVDGAKATPAWKNTSGEWAVSDYKYSGQSGLAYRNVSGPLENWKFSATITNVSGSTGGQVFVMPTNPETLVGFWPFDKRNGSVAYDYSGNRNNGTLTYMNTTGNATSGWSSGSSCKSGGCMQFDGWDDHVKTSAYVMNSSVNATTYAFWSKTTLYRYGNKTTMYGAQSFIGDATQGSAQGFEFMYRANGSYSLTFQFEFMNITKYSAISASNYFSGYNEQWVHTVIVADYLNNRIKFYRNGQIFYTWNNTDSIGMLYPYGSRSRYIGSYSATGHMINGTMDEFMIFNRSLSDGEISALYETSTKKLFATGTQSIATATNASIVLANPVGNTKFDDVRVSINRNEMTMIVPYENIDINGTLRAGRGEHRIEIRHMGVNTTLNRAIIQITSS